MPANSFGTGDKGLLTKINGPWAIKDVCGPIFDADAMFNNNKRITGRDKRKKEERITVVGITTAAAPISRVYTLYATLFLLFHLLLSP